MHTMLHSLRRWRGRSDGIRMGLALYVSAAFLITGCDPVIGIAGATFPVWLLCLIVGVLAALALRPLLVAVAIDEWMTPRPLVYGCLAVTIACLIWLIVWWKA